MPTIIDANGLSIATRTELNAIVETGLKDIYGSGIVVDSNTADGQYFGITTQVSADSLEKLLDIYNMFDPDNCIGVQQDNLYWINGLTRGNATYSFQNITITVSSALTLNGLDASANDPDGAGYTVSDDIGNQWILLDTQNPPAAGDYTYSFRSKTLGEVLSSPNTIKTPVDVVLGVVSINNATGVSSKGNDGELDAAFRKRRGISFAKKSTNSMDGLLADLANLEGVISVVIYDNVLNTIDADGIPAHGFWVIIEGGSGVDIGNAIYSNVIKSIPSKGNESQSITTIQDQIYIARYDRPDTNPLYIKFDLKPLKTGQVFDIAGIKDYIVENKVYLINKPADTGSLTDLAMEAIIKTSGAGSGTPLSLLISQDNSNWVSFLQTDKKTKWVVDAINIAITEI